VNLARLKSALSHLRSETSVGRVFGLLIPPLSLAAQISSSLVLPGFFLWLDQHLFWSCHTAALFRRLHLTPSCSLNFSLLKSFLLHSVLILSEGLPPAPFGSVLLGSPFCAQKNLFCLSNSRSPSHSFCLNLAIVLSVLKVLS
jgi:hypothetical protein